MCSEISGCCHHNFPESRELVRNALETKLDEASAGQLTD